MPTPLPEGPSSCDESIIGDPGVGEGVLVLVGGVVMDGVRVLATLLDDPCVVGSSWQSSTQDMAPKVPDIVKHLSPRAFVSAFSLCNIFFFCAGATLDRTKPRNSLCHTSKSIAKFPSESVNSFTLRAGVSVSRICLWWDK